MSGERRSDAPFKSARTPVPRIGDQVVCENARGTHLSEGAVYTIHDFPRRYDGSEPPYLFLLRNDAGVRHGYAPERFRLFAERSSHHSTKS